MSLKSGHERCIIPGCRASNMSLHSLPKEPSVANKWMDFIFGDLPRSVPSKSFRVCTAHFTPECIENLRLYEAGVVSKLILKKGSIPTMRDPSPNIHTVSQTLEGTHVRRSETIGTHVGGVTQGSSGSLSQLSSVRDVACQTDHEEKKSVGTQLSKRTLQNHIRSTATQVQVSSRDCGVCTLTFPLDSPLLFLQPTITERPSKRPRLSLPAKEEDPSEYSLCTRVEEPHHSI
ncbi:uncharacterized protein ACBR49_004904 isoform 1-T1 [Aulostomus maculatus]